MPGCAQAAVRWIFGEAGSACCFAGSSFGVFKAVIKKGLSAYLIRKGRLRFAPGVVCGVNVWWTLNEAAICKVTQSPHCVLLERHCLHMWS
jgi:hypothetical protein